MKKIISIFSVVCMIVTLFTFNVSAATEFTLSIEDDVTTANYGDQIVALITLSDTVGIKAIGAGVAFDTDFVLGFDADTDEEIDENWVSYTYYSAYNGLGAKYKWGTPTYGVDTAVLPGYTYANAQYAKASAVTSSKTNIYVMGVVLKVNTQEKKMAKISMPATYWGDAEGNKTTIPAQTIEIALNGYTGEEPDPTPTDTPIAEDFKDDANLSEDGYYAGAEEITSGTVSYGDYSAEMGANGKVHTFFAKAVTGLDALSYGVKATINGKAYYFPGKARVEANQAWAIKIIIPNGTFEGGASAVITDMEKYTK